MCARKQSPLTYPLDYHDTKPLEKRKVGEREIDNYFYSKISKLKKKKNLKGNGLNEHENITFFHMFQYFPITLDSINNRFILFLISTISMTFAVKPLGKSRLSSHRLKN